MDEIDEDLVCLIGLWLVLFVIYKRRQRVDRWRNRRWRVHPINRNRDMLGDFNNLWQEMKIDETVFFRYKRMDLITFNEILEMISPYLLKHHPRALEPELRLGFTLRYLATGDTIISLALAYRIGESTARGIIKEICEVLAHVLSPVYLQQPTEEQCKNIAADFLQLWNIPNCVGAIDGKHIVVQAPPNSGSLYFNYKKTFSIVLLAVCDANCKFTLIHVGEMGSNSDASIFGNSAIGELLRNEELGFPKGTAALPGSRQRTACFFVGDNASPLMKNLMKPYSRRQLPEADKIFNYRLSRARRTIENAFGILSARWCVFRKPIAFHSDIVDKIILATICLHNCLKSREEALNPHRRRYCPANFLDYEDAFGNIHNGRWREEGDNFHNLVDMQAQPHPPVNAIEQRNILRDYFLTVEGEVPWQQDYV